MTLATDLSTLKDGAHAHMPKEHSHAISKSIEDFVQAWNPANAVNVGQPFPDFSLSDATGKQVSLMELLAKGPLLISFYRGGWCPYCNMALRALQDSLSAIKARGVTLVAISPELPNQSLTMQEKSELQFPVLSDVANNLARKLGILFQQPDTLRPILKAYGVDLQARNGDDSYEVPFPASYFIDSKGMIRSAFLDPDYMGYFGLTLSLLDLLKSTKGARVVSTSSLGHKIGKFELGRIAKREPGHAGWPAYGESKYANILFTRELARRLEESGATANCFNPGFVHSGFGLNNGGFIKWAFSVVSPIFAQTPEKGADTLIWLATSPEAASHTGEYFSDLKVAKVVEPRRNDELARGLWALSEKLYN